MRAYLQTYHIPFDEDTRTYVLDVPDGMMPTSIIDFGVIQTNELAQVSVCMVRHADVSLAMVTPPVQESEQLTLFDDE